MLEQWIQLEVSLDWSRLLSNWSKVVLGKEQKRLGQLHKCYYCIPVVRLEEVIGRRLVMVDLQEIRKNYNSVGK